MDEPVFVSTLFIEKKLLNVVDNISLLEPITTVSPCAYQNDELLMATMTGDLPAGLEFVLEGATHPCGLSIYPKDHNGTVVYKTKSAEVGDFSDLDFETYSTSGNISNFGPGPVDGVLSSCFRYGDSCIELQNKGNAFLLDGQGFNFFSEYAFVTQIFGFSVEFTYERIRKLVDDEIEPIDSITKTTLKDIIFPGELVLFSIGPSSFLESIPGANAILSASMELVTENIQIEGNFSFSALECNHTIDLSGITIGNYCCCTIVGRDDLESSCHNKDIGNLFNDSCPVFFKGPATTDCVCPPSDPPSGPPSSPPSGPPSAAARNLPSLFFPTLFTVMTLSRMFRSS